MVIEEKIFDLGFFSSIDTFNFSSPTAYRNPLVKAQSGREPMPLCDKATLLKGVTVPLHIQAHVYVHTGICVPTHLYWHTCTYTHVHTHAPVVMPRQLPPGGPDGAHICGDHPEGPPPRQEHISGQRSFATIRKKHP